jgi:predicted NBD/HSP70 family sugar kinase
MSKQAIHHDVIKRHNFTQVFLEIQRSQELVKSDLVKHVHLSFAAVSAICDNLERNSLISIGGEANSTGGRRPKKIIFNSKARWILSVDLSIYENLQVSVLDLDYTICWSVPLGHGNLKETIEQINKCIDKFCIDNQSQRDKLIGACIIVPGLYDSKLDRVVYPSNDMLLESGFRARFEESLQLEVVIVNDADVAALGQSIMSEPPVDDLVLLYFSQGVGLGIVHDGRIYSGAHGMAGEFGKVRYPLSSQTRALEECIMLETIVHHYSLSLKAGCVIPLEQVFGDANSSESRVTIERLVSDLSSSKPLAQQIIDFYSKMLSWAISILIDILDPSAFFLAGNIEPLLPFMLPGITREVAASSVLMKVKSRSICAGHAHELTSRGSGKMVLDRWLERINL